MTTSVYRLLKINKELHVPPRLLLRWGTGQQMTGHGAGIEPWMVLDSISEEFTLFSPAGIPLRAKLTVSFGEAWTIQEQLQIAPLPWRGTLAGCSVIAHQHPQNHPAQPGRAQL
jgi:Contractile injection system tube protein